MSARHGRPGKSYLRLETSKVFLPLFFRPLARMKFDFGAGDVKRAIAVRAALSAV